MSNKVRTIIITPLYYLTKESAEILTKYASEDNTLIVYDDIGTAQSSATRAANAMNAVGLSFYNSFDNIVNIITHDNVESFWSNLSLHMEDIKLRDVIDNVEAEYQFLFFPTSQESYEQFKKFVKKEKGKIVKEDNFVEFIGVDLSSDWEDIKETLDPIYKIRFGQSIENWINHTPYPDLEMGVVYYNNRLELPVENKEYTIDSTLTVLQRDVTNGALLPLPLPVKRSEYSSLVLPFLTKKDSYLQDYLSSLVDGVKLAGDATVLSVPHELRDKYSMILAVAVDVEDKEAIKLHNDNLYGDPVRINAICDLSVKLSNLDTVSNLSENAFYMWLLSALEEIQGVVAL